MIRSAPTTAITNQHSQSKATEQSLRGAENMQEQSIGMGSGFAAGLSSFKKGFDLAQVPAKPGLHKGLSVQCCAKDGKPCSCPKCKAKAEMEDEGNESRSSGADAASDIVSPTASLAETVSQREGQDTVENTETTATESTESQSRALIVDTPDAELQDGQMTKTDFLRQLRDSICGAIGPVLATAGQTTEGCPYLNYWLSLYEQKSAAETESTVRRYAPDSVRARTALEYVSIVTSRALRAAEIWARTGRIMGVPEEVSTNLPGEMPAPSNTPPVMAKAKEGGAKKTNDPAAIQEQLGAGNSLSTGVQSRMESAFNTSFADVRTHTDSNAARVSNYVNARAFTVGNHVAFDSGEYQPGTLIGDALIAHELAHVMQQRNSQGRVNKMEIGESSYESLETDADIAAAGAISSLWGMTNFTQKAMPALRSGLRLQGCRNSTKVNSRANPCTTRAAAPTPAKTVTIRPTYLWGGSTSTKFNSQLTYANNVYRIAGLNLVAGNALTINETDTKDPGLLGSNAKLNDGQDPRHIPDYTAEEIALLSRNSAANEVSAYYVLDFENQTNIWGESYTDSGAFVQKPITTDRVLAHELGHVIISLGHPSSNNDNIMAQSSVATGVDCLSDDQITAARASNFAR